MNTYEDIAIIGMSGIFPEADTLAQLQENLMAGRDSVREMPEQRIIHSALDPWRNYQVAGFLDRADQFDHKFFGISLKEAEYMDPQQRIVVELVCRAIEDAGYSLKSLRGSETALILGSRISDYTNLVDGTDAAFMTGNSPAMTAGRISYLLNLTGPAMMLDTACSSSLVAVHEACLKIITGEAESALAGALSVNSTFTERNGMQDVAGILSPEGRSRTFDASANGTGTGEGGGIVFLKSLKRAQEDNDHIYAIIKGSALNHDGSASNGLTAPSPSAQTGVILKAWKRAGIDPETITYAEAHGTGTKLGDPIEFQALTEAFSKHTSRKHFCSIGTIKTNLGHLDNAAGIAGLIKTVLSLKSGYLFPSLHFKKPNPFINFDDTALYVNTSLKKWDAVSPRRASLSSFGISGTNAHLVLEEASEKAAQRMDSPLFLKISAKTEEALGNYTTAIRHYLENTQGTGLHNGLFTLNTGRDDYACRRAYSAASREELLEKLSRPHGTVRKAAQEGLFSIFAFADGLIPASVSASLSARFPLFKEASERVLSEPAYDPANQAMQVFANHYALYHLVLSLGITPGLVIGTGIGRITKQLLVDGLSIPQALSMLVSPSSELFTFDKTRLYAVIDSLGKENPFILEMGTKGIIGNALEERGNTMFSAVVNADGIGNFLERYYEQGGNVSWKGLYAETAYSRVSAPTYPFEKTRCWPKPALKTLDAAVAHWMYETKWVEEPVEAGEVKANGIWVILSSKNNSIEELGRTLTQKGFDCLRVTEGLSFQMENNTAWECDFKEEGFLRLSDALKSLPGSIKGIVYAMDDSMDEDILLSLASLSKSLHDLLLDQSPFFTVLTSASARVLPAEPLNPVHASVAGFLNGMQAEYPKMQVKLLDFLAGKQTCDHAELLIRELFSGSPLIHVGYRGERRYVRSIVEAAVEAYAPFEITEDSLYLVTGGTSGIGAAVASYLLSKKSRVALLSRSSRPSADLLEHGNAIQGFHADLGDEAAVGKALDEIGSRMGRISGVFHAAGIPGGKRIREHSGASFREVLKPKITGTRVLYNALCEKGLDFFAMFSSLDSVVGKPANSDYAAANAFLDAFALASVSESTRVISINWPAWRETGMHHRMVLSNPLYHSGFSIRTRDGINALALAISSGLSNLYVVPVNPNVLGKNPYFSVYSGATAHSFPSPKEAPEDERPEPVPDLPADEKLYAIIRQVLKAESIAPDDDYFEIGGNSLNGTQLINIIEKEFGVQLLFLDILDCSTVREIADLLEAELAKGRKSTEKTGSISKALSKEHYLLTPAQTRLYMLSNLQDSGIAYNMPGIMKIDGPLDKDKVEQAFAKIIERHENLRTSFVELDGIPRQIIHDSVDFRIEYLEMKEEAAQALLTTFCKPFAVGTAPLIRVMVIKVAENTHYLAYDMHHIVSDGVSIGILAREFVDIYTGKELAPLKLQYRDYSEWFLGFIKTAEYQQQRNFWLDRFSTIPQPLNLPCDFERPKVQSFDGDTVTVELDAGKCRQLHDFANETGATVYMVLLAIFNVALSRFTNQDDIIVGTPVSGRSHADTSPLIGVFVNTLLMRNHPSQGKRFNEFLDEVKKAAAEAYANQDYPFEELLRDLKTERDNGRTHLFSIMFSYEVLAQGKSAIDSLEFLPYKHIHNTSKTDLTFLATEGGDIMFLQLEYCTKLFAQATVKKMLDDLIRVMDMVISDKTILLQDIELDYRYRVIENTGIEDFDFNNF